MKNWIHSAWQGDTLEALSNFIKIPAKSKDFDQEWETHGFLKQALEEAMSWGKKHFPQATFEIHSLPGIPPVLYFDIPSTDGHTGKPVFFYGHLDKQPETSPWSEELGPWNPVVRNNRLYGRGAVDDGYAFYTTITAIKALEETNQAHPRICGLFETDEESGSTDLATYLKMVDKRIGEPAFICILDLFASNLSRIWLTQSLRGIVNLVATVSVLTTPAHSGVASGIVPSSFRIMRELLDRIEDAKTGKILVSSMYNEIPDYIKRIAHEITETYDPRAGFKYHQNTQSAQASAYDALMASTWLPTLSVLGAAGLPPTSKASGLVRNSTSLKLSFRIPPGVDGKKALQDTIKLLTHNVPYNATVEISNTAVSNGFCAPQLPSWLEKAGIESSEDLFGSKPGNMLCGGSIGTLTAFQESFPTTPFINTGALDPESNAHAPDESLDLLYAEALTVWTANLVVATPQE